MPKAADPGNGCSKPAQNARQVRAELKTCSLGSVKRDMRHRLQSQAVALCSSKHITQRQPCKREEAYETAPFKPVDHTDLPILASQLTP